MGDEFARLCAVSLTRSADCVILFYLIIDSCEAPKRFWASGKAV